MSITTDLQQYQVASTGPATVAGRFLRKFWTPVALVEDVKPGRAKPVEIMGEWYTYFRGTAGAPHLVGPRCVHRGTQLSLGRVEGDSIRCLYHGWKYNAQGQCVERPAEGPSIPAKVCIPSFPVREYMGLVFAYLGSGSPPPFPQLHAFERPGLTEAMSFTRRTNYFNQLENAHDQVHFNFVHKNSGFTDSGINRDIPEVSAEETEYGLRRVQKFKDGRATINFTLMPLSVLTKVYDHDTGWTNHISWRVPVNDTTHTSFIVDLIEKDDAGLERYRERKGSRERLLAQLPAQGEVADAILRGEMHIDEVSERRPDIIYLQDDVVLLGQPSFGDRPEDLLGRSDTAVVALRRLYARELAAVAKGEEGKLWLWPPDLEVTLGV